MTTRGAPSENSNSTNWARTAGPWPRPRRSAGPIEMSTPSVPKGWSLSGGRLEMRVVGLQIGDRPAVQLDDQRLGLDAVHCLANIVKRARLVAPPFAPVRLIQPCGEQREVGRGYGAEIIGWRRHVLSPDVGRNRVAGQARMVGSIKPPRRLINVPHHRPVGRTVHPSFRSLRRGAGTPWCDPLRRRRRTRLARPRRNA